MCVIISSTNKELTPGRNKNTNLITENVLDHRIMRIVRIVTLFCDQERLFESLETNNVIS